MFKAKKEVDNVDVSEIIIENEKLKIENETLKYKLSDKEERLNDLLEKNRALKRADAEALRVENEKLKSQIQQSDFERENNTEHIELKTQNSKLESELEIQKSENEHLKKLLDTYRAMPDVQNMVKNLSELAVPSIDELKKFAQTLSETQVSDLCGKLAETNSKLSDVLSRGGFVDTRRPW